MKPSHVMLAALVALVAAAPLLVFGCSSDRNPPTLPGAHPAAWMDAESEDFHGPFVIADGTASCSHCHGIDQPGGQVGVSCTDCHGPGTGGCLLCHGGDDNATSAPPVGLRGEMAGTSLAVGAHTAHLDTTSLGAPVPCAACHVVPVYLLSPPHLDTDRPSGVPLDSIAEVVWQGIADGGGAAWDRSTGTCSGTYCHGNFAGGDDTNQPVWTGADQATCGSCHDVGSDPAQLLWKHEYHVTTAGLACGDCHASVVDMQWRIIAPVLHVNGVVDTLVRDPAVCAACHGSGQEACTRCHGGSDNTTGAPPLGLEGETATNQLAVGAHSIHMEGGWAADGFDCEECHAVPQSLLDPGHLDGDDIAELTWGPLAGGASSWTRSSATCSGTYCHGNFAGGKSANSPIWTGINQGTCGSCHDVGYDPTQLLWKHEYHVNTAGLACGDCHASVVDMQLSIIALELHVDGVVDTLVRDPAVCAACHGSGQDACTRCHGGTDNTTGAPPLGLEGETATNQLAVGAHSTHMEGGTTADAFECGECHVVPQSLLDPGHLGADEIAEMTWGALAGGASSWTRASATCGGTYCHGNFAGGDGGNTPVWTGANQASCGSCHDVGSDPESLSGRHKKHIADENLDCMECHSTVVSRQMVIVNTTLHVDGLRTVSLLRSGTYQNGSCSGLPAAACHGTEDWYDN